MLMPGIAMIKKVQWSDEEFALGNEKNSRVSHYTPEYWRIGARGGYPTKPIWRMRRIDYDYLFIDNRTSRCGCHDCGYRLHFAVRNYKSYDL